ncbi:MAG: GTP-binding protein [Cupriavidus sp.]|nr:MAG: GTP-binding protein [Cupriavidus sp.]
MTGAVRLARGRARIPLTVIGGFLGAGKTTLVNRLLARMEGVRMALLVNDFGAVNIDAALVRSRSADTISLTNGCVCCQIGDALVDTLAGLIEAPQPPEWIVIEASGVSDTWRIAQAGLADPALALDGVVVMADAQAIRSHAEDPRVADVITAQLAAADVVILNKMDGRAPDPALDAWIAAHAGAAPIVHATDGDVPLAWLTGLALPSMSSARWSPCAHHPGACCCGTADHGALFDSMALDAADAVFDTDAVRALLRAMPAGVLRLKGVVQTHALGASEVQFAGKRGSVRRHAGPGPAATPGVLIAIGVRGVLPRAALAEAWRACRVSGGAATGIATAAGTSGARTGPNDRHTLDLPASAVAGVP